jgi:hypothetical protein
MTAQKSDNPKAIIPDGADHASPGALQRHASQMAAAARTLSPTWQATLNALPRVRTFWDPHRPFRREQAEKMVALELETVAENLRTMVLMEKAHGGFIVGQAQGALARDLNERLRVEIDVIMKANIDVTVNFAAYASEAMEKLKSIPNLPAEYLQRKIDELYAQADALSENMRAVLAQQVDDLLKIVRTIIQRNVAEDKP